MSNIYYENGISIDGLTLDTAKTSALIEKQKQDLELRLAVAMQDVILEWQKQTGLNIENVIPHMIRGYDDGLKTKSIVSEVRVVLDYKV